MDLNFSYEIEILHEILIEYFFLVDSKIMRLLILVFYTCQSVLLYQANY